MSFVFSSSRPGTVVTPCDAAAATPHWIEIELLDEGERPVAGERYWIRLTDGSTHHGHLDKDGRARYDGIDAGLCQVSFPDLDGMAWSGDDAAGPDDRAPDRGDLPPRAWIGVTLLDLEGEPVVGERYELRLPDGSVHKGVLDLRGSVHYGDIDPGECELCFPDLPADNWESQRGADGGK